MKMVAEMLDKEEREVTFSSVEITFAYDQISS